ncbi:MAG: 4Fe-4S binding protein [Proteobacteria bacterium]|nr:4Fe-4S binding protein [Pseudomonadota bacterium]
MGEYLLSVAVDEEKCTGCMKCMRKCPTEAIRIHKGKARVMEDRCVDCAECMRVCPNRAWVARTNPLSVLSRFKYNIALPSPALYGQFSRDILPNTILKGLKELPFDDVYDVTFACEFYGVVLKEFFDHYRDRRPAISSVCPVVVKLIQVKFPDLTDLLVPLETPRGIAAMDIKSRKSRELGIKYEDIGAIYIAPCPAKIIPIVQPQCKEVSPLDAAVSIADIYGLLLSAMRKVTNKKEELHLSGGSGISWAITGGATQYLGIENCLAVDGIDNVIEVLEHLEDEKLNGIKYLELRACPGGCVGGALNVDNHFLARNKILMLIKMFEDRKPLDRGKVNELYRQQFFTCDIKPKPLPMEPLDRDTMRAIQKVKERDKIFETLPRIDCGACGAPTCRSLAEDIVQGRAAITDCIFKLLEKGKA